MYIEISQMLQHIFISFHEKKNRVDVKILLCETWPKMWLSEVREHNITSNLICTLRNMYGHLETVYTIHDHWPGMLGVGGLYFFNFGTYVIMIIFHITWLRFHKPCGQQRGRGFLKQPCLSTRGEGVLVTGPRGQDFDSTKCCSIVAWHKIPLKFAKNIIAGGWGLPKNMSTRGEGVKNIQNFVHMVYEWPLW